MARASEQVQDAAAAREALSFSTSARWSRSVSRFFRTKPLGAFGLVIVLALLVVALIPSALSPYHYKDINILMALHGPSSSHLFGTDNQGRDILSRVIYGAQTSVVVGLGAVAIATVISTAIGTVSGFFGGAVDIVIQRFVEVWMAFPGIMLLIFLVSILGPSRWTVIVSIGLLFSAGSSRVIRSQVISVKSRQYIEATRATGAGSVRLILFHVIPNVLPIILVNASVQIGAVILIESSLAFLGFGVPPPFPSWGQMLQSGQSDMQYHPYVVLVPGLLIAITVYAFNMFGDALRDVLDPRLRGSR